MNEMGQQIVSYELWSNALFAAIFFSLFVLAALGLRWFYKNQNIDDSEVIGIASIIVGTIGAVMFFVYADSAMKASLAPSTLVEYRVKEMCEPLLRKQRLKKGYEEKTD